MAPLNEKAGATVATSRPAGKGDDDTNVISNNPNGAKIQADVLAAVEFLQKLRPGGPWLLTAIIPDGATVTETLQTPDDVAAFIERHNGHRNIYYSVNPTRTALRKKASKADIAAIEFLLGDLDPAEGETPDAAKARYLDRLNGEFQPKPTAIIDSGNGTKRYGDWCGRSC